MEATEKELLDAAKGGDRRALSTLLARFEGPIFRFGMKMCRDQEDAKEILQETLVAVARTLPDFRGASSTSTWLYTIARSFCIKMRRRRKHAPEEHVSLDDVGAEGSAMMDPARLPDEALSGKRIESALEEAIDALAPDYREVLVLRDVEGLSAPEVAEVLGIRVDAVKSRLHRARVAVRTRIAPLLDPNREGDPGPACPDVLTLLSKSLESDIDADLCRDMEKHVAGCDRCRLRCDSLKRTLAMCRSAPAAEVPAGVQDSVRAAVRELLHLP